MILIIVLYALCASMFTVSKAALFYSRPLFFMAVRMLGAGILLGLYGLYRSYKSFNKIKISKPIVILFIQAIIFHIYITYVLDLWSLDKITSTESAFIYNLSPFITALFSYIWFGESMTWKKWVGLLLGFSSLMPLLFNGVWSFQSLTINMVPKLATLGAVTSSCYGWVVVRNLVKNHQFSTISVNSISMFVGGFLALLSSLYFELWSPLPVTAWAPFLKYTFLIIILANILFYNLYGYLLKLYTATFLSFAGFMCPFFAAFFGWFFLGETLSPLLIISFILVTTGLYIFYQEELRQGYIDSFNKV